MSNINKQALRQKSEAASAGEWIKESGAGWYALCSSDDQANSGFIVARFEGPDSNANRQFVQAANPVTVLALLDELEAADALNKHLELAIRKGEGCSEALRRKKEAAEERVAELEAREVKVKQFSEFQICHYGGSEDYAKGYIDCQKNYNKALGAANILVSINGEG
ncbi:TPA: ead/Ea22-like family protein [Escherichia coli]|nr:ead/Ea22-like family protein [Escherichia coli]